MFIVAAGGGGSVLSTTVGVAVDIVPAGAASAGTAGAAGIGSLGIGSLGMGWATAIDPAIRLSANALEARMLRIHSLLYRPGHGAFSTSTRRA